MKTIQHSKFSWWWVLVLLVAAGAAIYMEHLL